MVNVMNFRETTLVVGDRWYEDPGFEGELCFDYGSKGYWVCSNLTRDEAVQLRNHLNTVLEQ